ncbi:MAG: 30S ribosomal protein S19 [Candidatus Micrarchaeota archaeon]
MAKKFNFRGKTSEELAAMTIDQFSALLTSRARRAVKRAAMDFSTYRGLLEKVKKLKKEGKAGKVIKTRTRNAVILPDWVGLKFGIYNGKEYNNIIITDEMIGRRLGEMAHSTDRVLHSGPGVGATRGSKFIPLK